ncbi:alkaline phosphatase family protein [Actinomadura rayongensis]|uniref:phospholipase C n=1 Tax=Actinomadura rayongensis TaxID=1429076 RepID=A0A6I4WF33_9ACTN|nr:alkaline phosphatase family protein [Actinomadura rayongensis]MXQ66466.1 twin-arginine translocation signal domain-containing protein [Actinomadura rayongensis]
MPDTALPNGTPTRRRFLTAAGAATAAALAADVLPPNVRRALAAAPARRAGRIGDIEHVVILMQENRSFDHYFGTLPGVAGFDDPDALTLSTGRSVFHQPDEVNPAGYVLPFHLDTGTTSAQAIPSTSHAWSVQHAAWNHGKMDAWLPAHRKADGVNGPYVMGYYTREDIPFHFALAEQFTVCDQYHCSVFGPTWPNRLYLMSASIDPSGERGGPVTSNVAPTPYRWKTYPEALTEAGVTWKVYQESDNYGCNVLEQFEVYQDAPVGSTLHRSAMRTSSAGRFEYDASHDRLPTVSWIIPTSYQSEHPDYTPAAGADFIASKIDAIASNPDVWAKTVFILTYDENDGLFDHVPPPTPPDGTPDEFIGGLPIGGGFRVPCVIVSPWTRGGWVASEKFDHTSPLRFLERLTGVAIPNLTAWRRRTFGDLTSAFGFASAARFPSLPNTGRELARAIGNVETLPAPRLPGAKQKRPVQERGDRPRPRG